MAHFSVFKSSEETYNDIVLKNAISIDAQTEVDPELNLEELSEASTIDFDISNPTGERINEEENYGIWHSRSLLSEDVDTLDSAIMVAQENVGTLSLKGIAAVKITGKDSRNIVGIPVSPGGQVGLAGAAGVCTMKNKPSRWDQLVNVFKRFIKLTVSTLLVYWGPGWSTALWVYKAAREAGLGPKLPWHTDKERLRILGLTGSSLDTAKYEFPPDKNFGQDYNQHEKFIRGWNVPSDCKMIAVHFYDSKYNDNDGHIKAYFGVYG